MTTPPLPFPTTTQEEPVPAPQTVPSNEQIGRGVRAAREAAGLAQIDLTRLIDDRGVRTHNSLISQVESGRRPLAFAEALAIAGALGIDVHILADYERIDAERALAEAQQALAEAQSRLAALAGGR